MVLVSSIALTSHSMKIVGSSSIITRYTLIARNLLKQAVYWKDAAPLRPVAQ